MTHPSVGRGGEVRSHISAHYTKVAHAVGTCDSLVGTCRGHEGSRSNNLLVHTHPPTHITHSIPMVVLLWPGVFVNCSLGVVLGLSEFVIMVG